jgi:DNA mismatch repair protein MutS
MSFHSILYANGVEPAQREREEAPDFFTDLNLDQIVEAITAGKQEYNLKPFFYTPLSTVDTLHYRHEIFRDLEDKTLLEIINSFAQKMSRMREHLAQADKLYYQRQKESWFLDAVEIYGNAMQSLVQELTQVELQAGGLLALRDYLEHYVQSSRFTSLLAETTQLKADLSTVTYCLHIKGNRIRVRKYEDEMDYSADVEETFAKFKQGSVEDYRAKFASWPDMNHVEAKILDFVAQLYPDIFSRLDQYWVNHSDYLDETIGDFDREIQFYVAYLEFIANLKRGGLNFCYPQVDETCKAVFAQQGFDLALANKLRREKTPIVCNDFFLQGQERIIVVSGPNQGGKTTFARMFGQLHYLASLGCPVPGREAHLFLFDRLFTHFEKEEEITNLRGKLQDDLVRIHQILDQATADSIIIINEIFTSTALQDAIFLGKKVMEEIIRLDALCVCVTFIDELAALSEKTVSMVSTVVRENPAVRTFKLVRRPADGLSHAIAIAEKYRLTYDCLKERILS